MEYILHGLKLWGRWVQSSVHEGFSEVALKERNFSTKLHYSEESLLTKDNCNSSLVRLNIIMFQELIIQVQTIQTKKVKRLWSAKEYPIFLLALVHFRIVVNKHCCPNIALCFYSVGANQRGVGGGWGWGVWGCVCTHITKKTSHTIFLSRGRRRKNRKRIVREHSDKN